MIEVAAGVLTDAQGRVLLMQRLPGTHLAGLWEFPGGKLEAGEDIGHGLTRELREELGIQARDFVPLISIPWRYPEKSIRLHALRVMRWQGEPVAQEGHALRWLRPEAMDSGMMPPADRPIVAALRLPDFHAISRPDLTHGAEVVSWLQPLMRDAHKPLAQLRLPGMGQEDLRGVLRDVLAAAPALSNRLLVNGDIELAREFGLGVHVRSAQLQTLEKRPLGETQWVGASCHDGRELELAAQIDADFATLSPVRETPGHPDAPPLGWGRFAELVAGARLPVYALGGIVPDDLDRARTAGAQGVAGIRAFSSLL